MRIRIDSISMIISWGNGEEAETDRPRRPAPQFIDACGRTDVVQSDVAVEESGKAVQGGDCRVARE